MGLACLADVIFTAQLAFSLCGLTWLRPSRPLATWSPLAITLVVGALARPQTRQASLGSSAAVASLRPIRPQLLDGLQALASLPSVIILLIGRIFHPIRHHCGPFGLSTEQ